MVDPDKIRQLVEMMTEHDLSEITLREGEEEVRLRRGGPAASFHPMMVGSSMPSMMMGSPAPPPAPAAAVPPLPVETVDEDLVPITSPMVGTLYTSSEPQAPPFVNIGAHVSAESVVCIVEAMKVFNEIKAGVAGTIEKVLVKNEDPVEFGQPLFLVRPD